MAKPALIIRLPNWIGDTMMVLPALNALQQAGIELHVFGRGWVHDLLAGYDFVCYSVPRSLMSASRVMRQVACKKLLVLPNSFSSAWMGRLAGKQVIGYYADARRFLLAKGLQKKAGQHEVAYFWDLASFVMQQWFPALRWPATMPSSLHLPVPDSAVAQAQQILKQHNVQADYWVLCPLATGQGDAGQSKIWPHWAALCQQLQQNGHTIIACPGPGEEAHCRALLPGALVLPNIKLDVYAAILAGANQVIANDSGPMHIAAAVNAATLGIFGVSDPLRVRPWGGAYVGERQRWPSVAEVIKDLKANNELIPEPLVEKKI